MSKPFEDTLFRAQVWAGQQAWIRGEAYAPHRAARDPGYRAGYMQLAREARFAEDRAWAVEAAIEKHPNNRTRSRYREIAERYVDDQKTRATARSWKRKIND